MYFVMRDIQARQVAAECPLTWLQVKNLACQATEGDETGELGRWINWTPPAEVGEWLWNYWMENTEPVEEGRLLEVDLTGGPQSQRAESTSRPATARDAGQKQPREAPEGVGSNLTAER